MTTHQVFILILIQLLILLLPSVGLSKMFEKAACLAGKPSFLFIIPGSCLSWPSEKHIGHSGKLFPWPVWFISMGIFNEFVKTFGKFGLLEHALAAFVPVFYFPYIGYNEKEKFIGPDIVRKHKKSRHANGLTPVFLPLLRQP